MPHITLSIPQDVYDLMKRHPEVKWTQIVRQSIRDYVDELEGESSMERIRDKLDPAVLAAIPDVSKEDAKDWVRKMREKGWKKRASWTRTHS